MMQNNTCALGFIGSLCFSLLIGCGATGSTSSVEHETGGVNVGYGTLQRDRLTTAVTTVSRAEIEASSPDRIEDVLRLAGVFVSSSPAGSYDIRIHSGLSIYGSNEPLFVIDGLQCENGYSSVLTALFPRDIEKVEVLKDAATAIYGSRGANGVILITTKSGR
jgi:TonB-dependent SusC/RagA subfamily outer membrane receptor